MWAFGSFANQGDRKSKALRRKSVPIRDKRLLQIDTSSDGYTLETYRKHYGGNGARLVTTLHHSGAANQPNPIFNDPTNTVDAGNWSITDSWAIPSTAVSGVYFAKLTTDSGNFQNMIPFIVRNDGTPRTSYSKPATRPGKRTMPGVGTICIKAPAVRTAIAPTRSATIVRSQ